MSILEFHDDQVNLRTKKYKQNIVKRYDRDKQSAKNMDIMD